MIVDLLRNDLARVAKKDSVDVRDLFAIETYPTLHQMVSTVTAELRDAVPIATLVSALFPCGSVTGAPKIRAMEVIRELEDSPRGVYCGAIGHFAPDGSAQFNVAIRTLTIEGGSLSLGTGNTNPVAGGVGGEDAGPFRESQVKFGLADIWTVQSRSTSAFSNSSISGFSCSAYVFHRPRPRLLMG